MSDSSTWNPYQILKIRKAASDDEIKSAYQRLAKEIHPDLHGGDPAYVIRFRDATEAYEILLNPEKRKEYDASYSESVQTPAHSQQEKAYNTTQSNTQEPIYDSETYTQKVQSEIASYRKKALKALVISLLWLFGGATVTIGSYISASTSGGGTYIIAWGAIVFGGFQTVKNFVNFVRLEVIIKKFISESSQSFNSTFHQFETAYGNYEINYEDQYFEEFIASSMDKCVVCGKMNEVNENCVCEACFRLVYK